MPTPRDKLFNWAKKRSAKQGLDAEALAMARQTIEDLSGLLNAARDESKLSNLPLKELRPRKSQWSTLSDIAQSTPRNGQAKKWISGLTKFSKMLLNRISHVRDGKRFRNKVIHFSSLCLVPVSIRGGQEHGNLF